ncbi:MAG: hypothetical protein HIU88_14265 [Acidobacteria bacterium]|nr:hypothetical protein [Acidobacteriota bacterium]
MGLLTKTFAAGKWSAGDSANAPFLTVDIYDSDIATISYEPGPLSGGLVYLGFQPRDYFEDDTASADVDLDGQAAALAAWARDVTGARVDAASIRLLLAEDRVEEPVDVFVEEAVARLLEILGLPTLPLDEDEA